MLCMHCDLANRAFAYAPLWMAPTACGRFPWLPFARLQIDQFIKDSINKRTDEYGGSIEKRCRCVGGEGRAGTQHVLAGSHLTPQ